MKPLLLLTLLSCTLFGCAAHKPVHNDKVNDCNSCSVVEQKEPPKIGAPPYFEGGEWKCGNNHYKYRPLTTECEREL